MWPILTKIFIFCSFLGISLTNECGDWFPFKDEKCFKVFDNAVDESTAEGICKQNFNESVLAIIKTPEEQQKIEEYLNTTNIADNVWIGIKKTNSVFKYLNGNDIEYKNWAKDRPLNNSIDLDCVEMSVDQSNYGKWIDDKCKRKNAVLCEKIQPWTVARLQSILLDTRRVYNEKIVQLISKQNEHTKTIVTLVSNPVPIGFIYVQLSGQSDPKTLWPNTEWENISAKFSGLFFRAEGGQSLTFGETQEQQTQSLEIISHHDVGGNYFRDEWRKITDTPWDKYLYTGSYDGENDGIKMKHNMEEIRPRNQAIRIWIRTK